MGRLECLSDMDTTTFFMTAALLLVTAGEVDLKPSFTTVFLLLLFRLATEVGVGSLFLPTALLLELLCWLYSGATSQKTY
jgi:hypothetical protein